MFSEPLLPPLYSFLLLFMFCSQHPSFTFRTHKDDLLPGLLLLKPLSHQRDTFQGTSFSVLQSHTWLCKSHNFIFSIIETLSQKFILISSSIDFIPYLIFSLHLSVGGHLEQFHFIAAMEEQPYKLCLSVVGYGTLRNVRKHGHHCFSLITRSGINCCTI